MSPFIACFWARLVRYRGSGGSKMGGAFSGWLDSCALADSLEGASSVASPSRQLQAGQTSHKLVQGHSSPQGYSKHPRQGL